MFRAAGTDHSSSSLQWKQFRCQENRSDCAGQEVFRQNPGSKRGLVSEIPATNCHLAAIGTDAASGYGRVRKNCDANQAPCGIWCTLWSVWVLVRYTSFLDLLLVGWSVGQGLALALFKYCVRRLWKVLSILTLWQRDSLIGGVNCC